MYRTLYSIQNKSGTGWLTCAHGRGFVSNAGPGGLFVGRSIWIEFRKIVETILLETQIIALRSSQVVHHVTKLTCGLCYGLKVQRCFLLEIGSRTKYSLFFIIWFPDQCFSISLNIPILSANYLNYSLIIRPRISFFH